jgi:V/A-type H+/Na+-transporting ATPase subunit D
MGALRAAATRSNLLRSRRRLGHVRRGVTLLTRKRESLVTELFRRARPAVAGRESIHECARQGYSALRRALTVHDHAALRVLGWPSRDLRVSLDITSVWGVKLAQIVDRPMLVRSVAARGTAPGTAGPAASETAQAFERLTEVLLDAVPEEVFVRGFGEELAHTSRQIHTLERTVAPSLLGQIAQIRQTLDERERDEHARLRHLRRRLQISGTHAT